ncbi:MAG: hypothetical protein HYR55_06685 [Acidobacteria bacterium]|nr:hypothetical protein [Acidobacteriota bacterium]MBI3658593.1 hypothetical protein [Acidobacteriota bacterium]
MRTINADLAMVHHTPMRFAFILATVIKQGFFCKDTKISPGQFTLIGL